MVQPTILEKLEELPESLQTEVLHYIEFLLDKHAKEALKSQQEGLEKQAEKQHGYGSWVGQIIMSDDFDEPLEDLKDYM